MSEKQTKGRDDRPLDYYSRWSVCLFVCFNPRLASFAKRKSADRKTSGLILESFQIQLS